MDELDLFRLPEGPDALYDALYEDYLDVVPFNFVSTAYNLANGKPKSFVSSFARSSKHVLT